MTPDSPPEPASTADPSQSDPTESLREELRLSASLAAEGFTPSGGPPGAQVLAAASHLARVADRTLHLFVAREREAGTSWASIGQTLGISRQAAQKRFGSAPPQRVTAAQAAADPVLVDRAEQIMDAVARHLDDVLEAAWSEATRKALGIHSSAELIEGIEGVFGTLVSRSPLEARVIAQVTVVTAQEQRSERASAVRVILAPDGLLIGLGYYIPASTGAD